MTPLIDTFGRMHTYLRISVTDRCNLRCVYCQPGPSSRTGGVDAWPQRITLQPREAVLTFDEIERVGRLFARLGVTKIRITGGEPLVRRDLPLLIARLARIPGIETLGMTTNGVVLARHARRLKDAGLTHLNVSLDTLRPERFLHIALRPHLPDVLDGIEAALAAGFSPLKLNVVVMEEVNGDELLDFVEFVRCRPINVRFIEYMPFESNRWNTGSFLSFVKMTERIGKRHELIPIDPRPETSAVAREFRIHGWRGTVGFIASMSENFCDTCNRLRLRANGSLKSCLFHPPEVNLRQALRSGASDAMLEEMIRAAVQEKPAGHAPVEELLVAGNRTMIEIGG